MKHKFKLKEIDKNNSYLTNPKCAICGKPVLEHSSEAIKVP